MKDLQALLDQMTLAEISEHGMREYYLPAYKACLDAGSPMVMNAFNAVGGIPAVANSH